MKKIPPSLLVSFIIVFLLLVWTSIWWFRLLDQTKKTTEKILFADILWQTDKDQAFLEAIDKNQLVVILIEPQSCGDCESKIQKHLEDISQIKEESIDSQFVFCKIDPNSSSWDSISIDDRFIPFFSSKEPAFLFFFPSEDLVHAQEGFPAPMDWERLGNLLKSSKTPETPLEEP